MFRYWWTLTRPVFQGIDALQVQQGLQARDVIVDQREVLILDAAADLKEEDCCKDPNRITYYKTNLLVVKWLRHAKTAAQLPPSRYLQ